MARDLGGRVIESLAGGHERIVCVARPEIGLQAVIAIHSTALGPALGGLRMTRYPSGLAEALDDALRLSQAMTLKAAAAGLDLGGGKTVVVDDGRQDLREARLTAVAQEIDRLQGAYITAEDIGTTTDDMEIVARQTEHVVGRGAGHGVHGDPSPDTARGVLGAIQAAAEVIYGSQNLEGRRVGVLGLGKVGGNLALALLDAGAEVIAYEPVAEIVAGIRGQVNTAGIRGRIEPAGIRGRIEPAGIRGRIDFVDSADALMAARLDVFSPCARGGLITEQVAGDLNCRIVCGAANNQLGDTRAAAVLAERGILYVPDFLANCGGLIHVDAERRGADPEVVELGLRDAQARTQAVLAEAMASGRLPEDIAEDHARLRIDQASRSLAAAA